MNKLTFTCPHCGEKSEKTVWLGDAVTLTDERRVKWLPLNQPDYTLVFDGNRSLTPPQA